VEARRRGGEEARRRGGEEARRRGGEEAQGRDLKTGIDDTSFLNEVIPAQFKD
jgi:hypothetical protein